MDEATIPIGVPCAAEAQVGSRQFFFVRIAVQNEQQPEAKTPQQVSNLLLPGSAHGRSLSAHHSSCLSLWQLSCELGSQKVLSLLA